MRIAYDPWMIRQRSLADVCRFAAEIGYEWLELSPRDDFLPLFAGPRAGKERIAELKKALQYHGIGLASMWTVYRWAEPNDSAACETAVRYMKQFIEIAAALECPHISSEFGGDRKLPEQSEGAFRRSIEQIVSVLEREKVTMALDPHPGDWVEDGYQAMDVIHSIGSPHLKFLYSAPHTFYLDQRGDMASLIRYVSPSLMAVRCADTFDHRVPVRYIVNPLGAPVVVHQHLNIGEGEIDWDTFFQTLAEVGFDGTICNSVFAWPDKAEHSARLMLQKIKEYLAKYRKG